MACEKEPALVIMAAGMGSRFGGLKQMEPIDEKNHILMDYSVYDAISAGFQQVLMIIRGDFEREFREAVGRRIEKKAAVKYVRQELDALPPGVNVPAGRVKPWGTAHAVWCCKDALQDMAFVTVNADDYYGEEAYRLAYRFLTDPKNAGVHAVVGYDLAATLSRNGTVTRGICSADARGRLIRIDEIRSVRRAGRGCERQRTEGRGWMPVPDGALASMNMWAFQPGFLSDLKKAFEPRLRRGILERPLEYEETLSDAVEDMLERNACEVRVLPTRGRWIGMTYREDMGEVTRSISALVCDGWYSAMS